MSTTQDNVKVIFDTQVNLANYNLSPQGTIFVATDTGQVYMRGNNAFGFSGASSFIPMRQAATTLSVLAGANPTLSALTLAEVILIAPANAVILPVASTVRGVFVWFRRTAAAGAVTITAAAGQTIDGGGALTLANDGSVHAVLLYMPNAGTDWIKLSSF